MVDLNLRCALAVKTMRIDSSFFFPSKTHLTAYRNLLESIQQPARLTLLCGPSGSGKTVIVKKAIKNLSSDIESLLFSNQLTYLEAEKAIEKLLGSAPAQHKDNGNPTTLNFSKKIRAVEIRDIQAITKQYIDRRLLPGGMKPEPSPQKNQRKFTRYRNAVLFFDDIRRFEAKQINTLLEFTQNVPKNINIHFVINCTPQQETQLKASINNTQPITLNLAAFTDEETKSYINWYLEKSNSKNAQNITNIAIEEIVAIAKGIPGAVNTLLRTTVATAGLN